MHVPNTGPIERERQEQIRRLEAALRRFKTVPPHRREAECADVGERDCQMMLAELGAPGFERIDKKSEGLTILSIDEFLTDVEG